MNERAPTCQQAIKPADHSGISRTGAMARKALFKLLGNCQHGQLVWKEQGQTVAKFGDSPAQIAAEIDINNAAFYSRILTGGSCAAGESFIDGWWNSPNLTQLVQFFAANLATLDNWEKRLSWLFKPTRVIRKYLRRNHQQQAKRNILAHYDLGNELYQQFLDPRMQYSSGIFNHPEETLSEAQDNKLKRLCDKLELKPSDHLLEIGSGWGGLAIYAAKHFGCRVTTTTISDAQFEYANAAIHHENLQERIQLLNQDYRLLSGQYDKIVSVEMIEAVGQQYLPQFFKQVKTLLKPGGKLMMQAITIADQRYDSYASGEDFIQKHIFPGGFLPSIAVMSELFRKHTQLTVRNLHDIGLDYARTLACWRDNLLRGKHLLDPNQYDDRFFRLWLFYLAYCEGGFLQRRISTVQLLADKPA